MWEGPLSDADSHILKHICINGLSSYFHRSVPFSWDLSSMTQRRHVPDRGKHVTLESFVCLVVCGNCTLQCVELISLICSRSFDSKRWDKWQTGFKLISWCRLFSQRIFLPTNVAPFYYSCSIFFKQQSNNFFALCIMCFEDFFSSNRFHRNTS